LLRRYHVVRCQFDAEQASMLGWDDP
jgi:hypothetical protein